MAALEITPDVSVLEVAHQIAQKQTALLDDMKTALESGDDGRVIKLARRLCGVREAAAVGF